MKDRPSNFSLRQYGFYGVLDCFYLQGEVETLECEVYRVELALLFVFVRTFSKSVFPGRLFCVCSKKLAWSLPLSLSLSVLCAGRALSFMPAADSALPTLVFS